MDKSLAAEALPAAQLDKPEALIIDHPACPQRLDHYLDSGAMQNHLRALGFSAALGGLRRGPAAAKEPFRRPALARAEEGLLHVMGVLRERDEVRTGFDSGTRMNRLDGSGGVRTNGHLKSTEDRDGEDRDGPIGTSRRIGQCVMRGFPQDWSAGWARVFKIESEW